jgi:hypothetical protein
MIIPQVPAPGAASICRVCPVILIQETASPALIVTLAGVKVKPELMMTVVAALSGETLPNPAKRRMNPIFRVSGIWINFPFFK